MPFPKLKMESGKWKVGKIFNFQLSTLNFSRGFTLIEILIVFAMIGIIAGMFLASYDKLQQKNRDSRRKQDLQSIKKALELAKMDSPGGAFYPNCPPDGFGFCGISSITLNSTQTPAPSLAPTYIDAIPKDSKLSSDIDYILYWPKDLNGNNCASNCTAYTLITCIENTTDPDRMSASDLITSAIIEGCRGYGFAGAYSISSD